MQVRTNLGASHRSDWRDDGACRDEDAELFFPTGYSRRAQAQARAAVAVCGRCPVAGECLTWALDSGERYGVWGGLTEYDRRAVLRSRALLAGRARAEEVAAGHPTQGNAEGVGRVA